MARPGWYEKEQIDGGFDRSLVTCISRARQTVQSTKHTLSNPLVNGLPLDFFDVPSRARHSGHRKPSSSPLGIASPLASYTDTDTHTHTPLSPAVRLLPSVFQPPPPPPLHHGEQLPPPYAFAFTRRVISRRTVLISPPSASTGCHDVEDTLAPQSHLRLQIPGAPHKHTSTDSRVHYARLLSSRNTSAGNTQHSITFETPKAHQGRRRVSSRRCDQGQHQLSALRVH